MPAKNESKLYVENSYYHIYNRGVEKRKIFQDKQDYGVFLSYLKEYLLPKDEKRLSEKLTDPNLSYQERDKILKSLRLNNFADQIILLAYCLMPNHFHILVKQKAKDGIDRFMNSLCTRYTMYFNKKYERVGPLYQSTYKAVLVETDAQLLHLTRYIHQNPINNKSYPANQGTKQGDPLLQPSSYLDYIGNRKTEWLEPSEILANFSTTNPRLSYENFMAAEENQELIADFTID